MEAKYIKEAAGDVVFNLEYNSERKPLIIPEYGRYLHKLIDQAVAVENREERNKMAKYIISVMGTMNPHLRDVLDFQHKLWDQLYIMSNFKIDVDSPYPIPQREVLELKPSPLHYPQNYPKYRFYGNNIQYMINVANNWDDGELKNALVKVIANHMKKSFLSWNKDTVTDAVIFEHLFEMSGGKLNLLQSEEELLNSQELIRTNKRMSNKIQVHNNKNKIQKNSNNNNNNNKKFNNNNRKPNLQQQ